MGGSHLLSTGCSTYSTCCWRFHPKSLRTSSGSAEDEEDEDVRKWRCAGGLGLPGWCVLSWTEGMRKGPFSSSIPKSEEHPGPPFNHTMSGSDADASDSCSQKKRWPPGVTRLLSVAAVPVYVYARAG